MTVPLIVLAIGSIVAGWPHKALDAWLEPVFPKMAERHVEVGIEYTLVALAVAAGLGGIALGSRLELKGAWTKVLANKWYVDEIYDFLFVNGLAKGGGTLMAPLRPEGGRRRRQRHRVADPFQCEVPRRLGLLDR